MGTHFPFRLDYGDDRLDNGDVPPQNVKTVVEDAALNDIIVSQSGLCDCLRVTLGFIYRAVSDQPDN